MNTAQRMLQIVKDSKQQFIRIPVKIRKQQPQLASPKRKGASFNRVPSLGSSVSHSLPRVPSLSGAVFNRGPSIGSSITPQTTVSGNSRASTSYSLDLWSAASSNTNISTKTLVDIQRYEAFAQCVESRWSEISDRVSFIINKSQRTTLPIPVCQSSHDIKIILSEPVCLNKILTEILSDDMNEFLQVTPKTILKLKSANIVRRLQLPVTTTSTTTPISSEKKNGPLLTRNVSIMKDDQDEPRIKVDLRLRKTPSEFQVAMK